MDRLPLGFLNLDKPAGPTSTALGSIVRRELRERLPSLDRKRLGVGHFGTLDPAATGVLPLAVGNATRLLPYIADTDKRYAFTLALGTRTHTGDAEGATTGEAPVPDGWEAALPAVLDELTGPGMQVPPMVSAVRVEGRRLHEIARAGETVERAPRPVILHALEIERVDAAAGAARLRVTCSAGTYVRTLCEAIAERLGTLGHMRELRRERAGPFALEEAVTLETVRERGLAALLDPRRVLPLSEVVLDAVGTRDFRFGRSLHALERAGATRGELVDGAPIFVSTRGEGEDELLGVGEVAGVILRPKVVFA